MGLRSIGVRVAAGVLGACFTVYLAAVGVYADVEGDANWWPYPWLAWVAALSLVAGAVWVTLALSAPTSSKPEPVTNAGVDLAFSARLEEVQSSLPSVDRADQLPSTHREEPAARLAEDMIARPRAGASIVVEMRDTGEWVGFLQPRRGGYRASHLNGSDGGWVDSIEEGISKVASLD